MCAAAEASSAMRFADKVREGVSDNKKGWLFLEKESRKGISTRDCPASVLLSLWSRIWSRIRSRIRISSSGWLGDGTVFVLPLSVFLARRSRVWSPQTCGCFGALLT